MCYICYKEVIMWDEKVVRNRKMLLDKLGYDSSWINDKTIPGEEFENTVKKIVKKKPTCTPKTYRELSYPVEIGGYGINITALQEIINRERKRYGLS